jgi:hypothetical protein
MTATELAHELAKHCERACLHLLPGGRIRHGNWVIGGTDGDAGKSLHIQLTGPKAGVWLDFSTGQKGDMMGLWQQVRGVDLKTAYREACEFLGIPVEDDIPATSPTWASIQREMGSGTEHDIATLASLRSLPESGLRVARDRGHLFFGPVPDNGERHHSWILTDSSRRNAQARRMDGKPWPSGPKAKTIPGCQARWPIGVAGATAKEFALVEGAPDFLAACCVCPPHTQPIAMLGSAQSIHPDAMPVLRSRTVWMFPHNDENLAGLQGAIRWDGQLRRAGCTVIPFDFSAYPGVKDLNDYVSACQPADEVEF